MMLTTLKVTALRVKTGSQWLANSTVLLNPHFMSTTSITKLILTDSVVTSHHMKHFTRTCLAGGSIRQADPPTSCCIDICGEGYLWGGISVERAQTPHLQLGGGGGGGAMLGASLLSSPWALQHSIDCGDPGIVKSPLPR